MYTCAAVLLSSQLGLGCHASSHHLLFGHTKLVMLSLHNHLLKMFQDICHIHKLYTAITHMSIKHMNGKCSHEFWWICLSNTIIIGAIAVYIVLRGLQTLKQLYLNYTHSTVIAQSTNISIASCGTWHEKLTFSQEFCGWSAQAVVNSCVIRHIYFVTYLPQVLYIS